MRTSSSLDWHKDEGYGHGLLSSGGRTSLAFAGMRHFSAGFSMLEVAEFAEGRGKCRGISARWVNATIKNFDCVQRLMQRLKTSDDVLFSVIVVFIVLIEQYGRFFIFFSVSEVPTMKRSEKDISTACCVASCKLFAYLHLTSCATLWGIC